MRQETYAFEKAGPNIYRFVSKGKREVNKMVEFTPTAQKMLYNLAFGDTDINGLLNDESISDNGDIIKVLATVIDIGRDFSSTFPGITIMFEGSTLRRTRMYNLMMRMYYHFFSIDFVIHASNKQTGYVLFETSFDQEYSTFYLKRINKN